VSERAFVLEGEKVALAVLIQEDVAQFAHWYQNLELTTYINFGFVATLRDEQDWFDGAVKSRPDRVVFAVLERSTRRLIGSCALFEIRANNAATLFMAITDPAYWNKGFGTEATRLLVEYGMFFCNLHHIKLEYVDFNARGRRAYEKAGFREAGRLRGRMLVGGERYDEVIMDITREEVDLSRMRSMIGLLPDKT
jgi:[ribosomal protein S5]-alanine N-acetyltransferase